MNMASTQSLVTNRKPFLLQIIAVMPCSPSPWAMSPTPWGRPAPWP